MRDKFIYVFDTASKDKLLRAGFVLLKEDQANNIAVFVNDERLSFALDDVIHISMNTLSYSSAWPALR